MTAEVIPFNRPKWKERKCSFCGKRESDVKAMINTEATGDNICNECIVKCKKLISEEPKQTS